MKRATKTAVLLVSLVIACTSGGIKMVKNVFIALLAIGFFVLVGCGASGPEKADSIEDIVGT